MKALTFKSGGHKGFTMVETVLAIGILSLAAVVGSRTLLSTTRGVHRLRFQKKASVLAEMIFQQYTAYSAQNFQLLSTFDAHKQDAKTFFNRSDNFGYDGILITTLATYAQNRSSCTINVTLAWTDAGTPKTSTYFKIYSPVDLMPSGGGTLQVWVKTPCAQGTSDPTIIASCPSVVGTTVTAPSVSGGGVSMAVTDSSGLALLKQVAIGNAVQVTVTAPVGSDYDKPLTVPGYYAGGMFGYSSSVTKTVDVAVSPIKTLVVTDFQPLGQIEGQVVNDDTGVSNPPVRDMTVALTFMAVAVSSGILTSNIGLSMYQVQSDANGKFAFHNVVPATASSVQAIGRPGSAPTIQQGDPSFQWGYTATTSVPIPDWSHPPALNPITGGPMVSVTTHLVRLGWAVFTVLNQKTNQPVAGLNLHIHFPINFWTPPPTTDYYTLAPAPDPTTGQETFYNLYVNAANLMQAYAGRPPLPGDHGYTSQVITVNCNPCVGQANMVSLPVFPGYLLTGSVVDDNPSPNLAALRTWAPYDNGQVIDMPANMGVISTPIFPFADGNNPGSSFTGFLELLNNNVQIPGTVVGHAVDTFTGAPGIKTTVEALSNLANRVAGPSTVADMSGYFTITSTFSYFNSITPTLVCQDSTLTCSMAGGLPLHIDTRSNRIRLVKGLHGFVFDDIDFNTDNTGVTPNTAVPAHLLDYSVSGYVLDVNSKPIPGAIVQAVANCATDGSYQGWTPVRPDLYGGGTDGTLYLIGGAPGYSYLTYRDIPIPVPADPTVPVRQDFQLSVAPIPASAAGF